MRIASPFQRGTGPGPWPLGRGGTYAVLACSLLGCFFGLEEVVPLDSGVGGGAGSGGQGIGGDGGSAVGGDAAVGGTGGTPIDPGCLPNEQNCGGGCVPISVENGCGAADCAPCAPLQHAALRCNIDNRACEVADCAPGFADCNGDTSSYTGQPGSDGCEYNFGPNGELRAAPESLAVPQVASIDITDHDRGDWAGIPAYPLLATCDDCVDTSLPTVALPNVVPPREDLDAYFRVAWDDGFFYLLGDVHDASVLDDGASRDGNCQQGQLCEDSLTVLVDGHNNRAQDPQPQADDLYLFLGLGGAAFRVAQRPVVPGSDLDFVVTRQGAACYRVEARFTWTYMTGLQSGQPDPQFAPAVGKEYGFDVAVNDWDPGVSDPATAQRDSQLFWLSPGNGFQQSTANFGKMTLAEGITDVPSGPE
jgi:hypothetical protein